MVGVCILAAIADVFLEEVQTQLALLCLGCLGSIQVNLHNVLCQTLETK